MIIQALSLSLTTTNGLLAIQNITNGLTATDVEMVCTANTAQRTRVISICTAFHTEGHLCSQWRNTLHIDIILLASYHTFLFIFYVERVYQAWNIK